MIDTFGELIRNVIKESGYSVKEFHSVEVIGGATRIQSLQGIIKEVFQVEDVSRTLNASESIARGCAIQAAIKSPLFQVAEYNIKERSQHNISCQYTVDKILESNEIEKKEFNNTLFKKNCEYPTVMTIGVQKALRGTLKLLYEEENPVHSQRLLVDISTADLKPEHDDFKLLMKGRIDDNGIISMKGCEMEENYIEEIRVPVKKEAKKDEKKKDDEKTKDEKPAEEKKEGEAEVKSDTKMDEEKAPEEEFTIEKKKKTKITSVNYKDLMQSLDAKENFESYYALEGRMNYKDKLVKDTLNVKNSLETYIYESRDQLQSANGWKTYSTEAESANILDLGQKTEEWLYNDGHDQTKDVYSTKLESMEKACNPVKSRMNKYLELRRLLNIANEKLHYFSNAVPTEPEKYSHLTQEEVGNITNFVQSYTAYFKESQMKLTSVNLNTEPPVKVEQFQEKLRELEKECTAILNKPKPAPPKEEKKDEKMAEETKKEGEKMQEEKLDGENGEQAKEEKPEKMDLELE